MAKKSLEMRTAGEPLFYDEDEQGRGRRIRIYKPQPVQRYHTRYQARKYYGR